MSMPNDNSEPTASGRWLRYGLPLAVIVLFAAGVFDFATLKRIHFPADERVNNGWTPTFFAYHISPSYNFSEDFHLYYVRAKRIERRGWTDSLFYSRPEEQTNYAAPLQVLLSRLALLTEGSPRRYSIYMFATLAIGWSSLYVAARSWLPREVSTASILLAVMITVLFEAVHLVLLPPGLESFGQWPTFRALRMSTMAWTSPVLVAAMIALVSLVYDRRQWAVRLAALAVMVGLLLGTDNWAFAMIWFATGLVAAWLAATAVVTQVREGARPAAVWPIVANLAALVLISFGVHEQLNGSLTGDALLRGGFGPEWTASIERDGNVRSMREWISSFALLPLAGVLLLSFSELRRERPNGNPGPRVASTTWAQLRWLALLPLLAALLLNIVLDHRGMECFLRSQLYWRVDYCLLFALVVVGAEWLRTALPLISPRLATSWTMIVALALTSLFVYHCYRTHWFVKHTARRDFFLTADAQVLQSWLEKFDERHDKYELATASVELNYLSAFWTNADLLLPSGFPYHNVAPNEEIFNRTVALMRLYRASAESWLRFTEPTAERWQDLWLKSRVAAAGRGYLYHLFHRWTYYTPSEETYFSETGRMEIAAALREPAYQDKMPTPEIILIDDVSRALGNPDLTNYRLGHRRGSIEAWVRNDVATP